METFDVHEQFERIKKDTVDSVAKALAVSPGGRAKGRRELRVQKVWVDDNLDPSDWDGQREAVRQDKTWGVPVYAALELVDTESGKVLSTTQRMKVATLPKPTKLGSFIVNGKHYQVYNQMRRKPGVYVIRRENGELKTDFHIAKTPFAINMDQKTGVFYLDKKGKKRPLYPVLSRMGVSDADLAKKWGEQVLGANKAAAAEKPNKAEKAVLDFAGDILREQFDSADYAAQQLRTRLEQTEVDPGVTKVTTGVASSRLTPDLLANGAAELLKTQQGLREPDDSQSVSFKKIFALGDLMHDRLDRQGGFGRVTNKIRQRLSHPLNPPTSITKVVGTNMLTSPIESFFTQSDLSMTPDQTNPIHIVNHMSKVTIRGEGGVVGSEHGIKDEERMLHPSQMGFIDPIHTPDSGSIGLVTTLALGATKDDKNDLRTRVFNAKSGKYDHITPSQLETSVIAFPDQFKDGRPVASKIRALNRGNVELVDADQVDFAMVSPKQAFSLSTNTIPFLQNAQGVRAQMATKMLEQAIPLTQREAPKVQVVAGKDTFEKVIGGDYSFKAMDDGVVTKVTDKKIIIKTQNGEIEQPIVSNLPLNNKSFLHAEPTVKPGDQVKKDQVIADTNFTRNGELAIGTNLRAAYMPYKGLTFEDGIVISERAAKKLSSEHMYQYARPTGIDVVFSKSKYLSSALGPSSISSAQAEKLDGDGVIMKGAILKKGDPIWVGVRDAERDQETLSMKRLMPNFKPIRRFDEFWTSDVEGEVVDVVKSGSKVKVFVKAREPAVVGDKLTNRHGAKGIITAILPDGQMPQTGDGESLDILLNPHGIVTRMNPSQILETAAGKVADATGKPYRVDNFAGGDYAAQVADDLAKAGVKDTEEVVDPATGKRLGEVLVGPQYVLKLAKQAQTQFSARAQGAYDINEAPLQGGDEGAKAVDMLMFYSLLSHGARANLREMATYKASKNQSFWDAISSGSMTPPPPEPTFAYKKFENYLRAAGVNVERKGSKIVTTPMTDREVERLSAGAIQDAKFFRSKDLRPDPGGLYDPRIFGGDGFKWGHIELAEPLPNPVFERPIQHLTGVKKTQFDQLVRGQLFYDPETGELNGEGRGVTGGVAFKEMLSKIDVGKTIAELTAEAKAVSSTDKLDPINKKLKFLHALKKFNLRPEEAYIQTKVPVLPTTFRKIGVLDDGSLNVAGLNQMYRDLALVNRQLAETKTMPFVGEMNQVKTQLRQELYDGLRAVAGPDRKSMPVGNYAEGREPRGIIQQIAGSGSPKTGFFQNHVLRKRQNLVGRGTIIPDPKLSVDEVGLPEDLAWQVFKPFVVNRLVNFAGINGIDAQSEIDNRTPTAKSALDFVMNERPVLLKRDPALHKFSVMAFKPKLANGQAIRIPPLVVKGFNADFDGDAMTVHVPLLPEAIDEAKKMMPSKNLYNPGTGGIMIAPQNEAALGLYLMSQNPKKKEELLEALPESLREKYKDAVINKPVLHQILKDVADTEPVYFARTVDKLKSIGDTHTYESGFTVSMKDLKPVFPERDQVLERAITDIGKKTAFDFKDPAAREKATKILMDADKELSEKLKGSLGQQKNSFFLMVDSGARGDMTQLKQVLSTPMLASDHRGNPIPMPITRSFAEGLPFSEYWSTLYGARRVATDKQLQTQNPGAFNKDIMATSITNVVASDDCHADTGIKLTVDAMGRDLEDRFLPKDIVVKGHVVAKAGAQVNSGLLNQLRSAGVKELEVRSPLTCRLPKGTCAKCYGLDESGQLPTIGTNIGAIAGQSMSEPLTQMTLKTFHMGGAVGSRGIISGYEKIDKSLKMHEIKRGKAELAQVDGKIARVEDAKSGTGKLVFVGGQEHFVPNDVFNSQQVRVGREVKRGDVISDGIVQPQELVELKGMLPASDYVTQQIQDAYKEQKVNLKRRNIETVLRSVANTTRIHDPGDSDFLPGDMAPYTVVEDFNRRSDGKKPVALARGLALREEVGGFKIGTTIDDRVAETLARLGKGEVEVGPKPIVHEPTLKGLEQLPMARGDWMAQLGYRKIANGIIEAAETGGESDLHGFSPVPAYAYGAEFGKAPGGKSKKEGVY